MPNSVSALQDAVIKGDIDEVKNHIRRKPNNSTIKCAFELALKFLQVEIAKLFIHSFDITKICRNSLNIATRCGNLEIVNLLIEKGADIKLEDDNGRTALHEISNFSSSEIAELLIEYGANVNAIDKEGNSPLHIAAQQGKSEKIEVLIKNKAETDLKNAVGKTALHLAVINGMTYTARFLIKKGADFNLVDKSGKKAISYAIYHKNKGVINMLESLQNMLESLQRFSKRGSIGFLAQPFENQVKEAIDNSDIKLLQLLLGPKNCQLWQYWLVHSVLSYNVLAAIKTAEYQLPIDILIGQKSVLEKKLEFITQSGANHRDISEEEVAEINKQLQEIETRTIENYTSNMKSSSSAMFSIPQNYDAARGITYPMSGDEEEHKNRAEDLQKLSDQFKNELKFKYIFNRDINHSFQGALSEHQFRVKANDSYDDINNRLTTKYRDLQRNDEKLGKVSDNIRVNILNQVRDKKLTECMYEKLLERELTLAEGDLNHCLRPDLDANGKDKVKKRFKENSSKVTKLLLEKFLKYAVDKDSNLKVVSVLLANGASLATSIFSKKMNTFQAISAIFAQSSDPVLNHFPNRSAFSVLKEVHDLLFDFEITVDGINISEALTVIPSRLGDFEKITEENAEVAIKEKPRLQDIGEEAEKEFMRLLEYCKESVSKKKSVEEKKLDDKKSKLESERVGLENKRKEELSEIQKFFHKLFRLSTIDEKFRRFREKYKSYEKEYETHRSHYKEFFIELGRLLETGYLAVATGDDRVIIDHAKRVERLHDSEKNEDVKEVYNRLKTILYEHHDLVKLSWWQWEKISYKTGRLLRWGPAWEKLISVKDDEFGKEVKLDCWSQKSCEGVSSEPAVRLGLPDNALIQEQEMRLQAEEEKRQAEERVSRQQLEIERLMRLLERASTNVEGVELVEENREQQL